MGWLALAGTALSAFSTIAGGASAQSSQQYQARQLKMQANATQAASQYQAEQDRRETAYVQSRAQAVAAASGAGATDKTVLDIQGRIEQQGEFKALADLWSGKESAAAMTDQAANDRQSGRDFMNQSYLAAGGTIAKGYAGTKTIMDDGDMTLYQKYADPYKLGQRADYRAVA